MLELSAPVSGGTGAGAGGEDGGAAFIDLMEVRVPAPNARLDQSELNNQVQRALATLSPTLREILLLAYFQRLSYAQIAEDLGIPLGTVKSRLHAAVAGFGKAWKQQQGIADEQSEADEPDEHNGDAAQDGGDGTGR